MSRIYSYVPCSTASPARKGNSGSDALTVRGLTVNPPIHQVGSIPTRPTNNSFPSPSTQIVGESVIPLKTKISFEGEAYKEASING